MTIPDRTTGPVPSDADLAGSVEFLAAFCRLWPKARTARVDGGTINDLVPHIETVLAAVAQTTNTEK